MDLTMADLIMTKREKVIVINCDDFAKPFKDKYPNRSFAM
jgi:hypothetical protein